MPLRPLVAQAVLFKPNLFNKKLAHLTTNGLAMIASKAPMANLLKSPLTSKSP